MRKKNLICMLLVFVTSIAKAGGIMTNTNYHIAFDRMFARGATFDIDAAFSNPAGLVWGYDGCGKTVTLRQLFPCYSRCMAVRHICLRVRLQPLLYRRCSSPIRKTALQFPR